MAKKKSAQADEPADPDALVRQSAGSYLSGDGRFEVRQSDSTWFVIDTEQTNELGQELLHGPFRALKAAREALPGARAVTPLPRTRRRPARAQRPKPPSPPPTWIDKLPKREAAEVRRLIRALEREGLPDAEAVARRDREGSAPAVAGALVERQLEALVAEATADERDRTREIIRRVTAILTTDEASRRAQLPGWQLVEVGPDAKPTGRRIRLR